MKWFPAPCGLWELISWQFQVYFLCLTSWSFTLRERVVVFSKDSRDPAHFCGSFSAGSLLFRTCSVVSSCCRLPKFWSLFPHFRENHHPLLWDFPSCFLCILIWLVPSGKNSGMVGRLISFVFLLSYNLCCPIPKNSCFRHFVQFPSYLRLEDKLDSSSWLEGKDLCIF